MRRPFPRLLWIVIGLASTGPALAQEAYVEVRPVEVQTTSQDAPTLRLQKSIEQALAKSDRFQMSTGGKPGTIVVSFRKPVEEREHMGRRELLYQVDYRSEKGVFLERASGACWSDEIDKCVFNVMRLANQAALKPVREPAR